MPSGWTRSALGEVAFVNPKMGPLSEDAPFVPMDAVHAGERFVAYYEPRGERAGARAFGGDVLFARITPCLENGKVAQLPHGVGPCGGSTEFIVIRGSESITSDFVYFWASSEVTRHTAAGLMTGTTGRQRLSWQDLFSIELDLPSIEEQRRIVDVVSSVDTFIDALQQQAETARTARNAVLHELLTAGGDDWTETTLGKTLEIARGGSPRPIRDYITSEEGGVNWVKIGDASASSKYIYQTEQKIRPEGILRSRPVKVGDFILSNSMSFGRPYIMRTDGCIHDGWLLFSKVEKHFDEDFLYNLLMSDLVQKQFDSLAAGSGVRNLNIEVAKEVVISLPPLKAQREIAEVANGLDEFILAVEQAVEEAKNLRSGLLSDLLSGEHEIPESYDWLLGAA